MSLYKINAPKTGYIENIIHDSLESGIIIFVTDKNIEFSSPIQGSIKYFEREIFKNYSLIRIIMFNSSLYEFILEIKTLTKLVDDCLFLFEKKDEEYLLGEIMGIIKYCITITLIYPSFLNTGAEVGEIVYGGQTLLCW